MSVAETVNVKNIGLRGVTVADTRISFMDGEKGCCSTGAITSKSWQER